MAGGDERAFETLYGRYKDPLYRYCRTIVRQPEDAEEALQGAMLKAFRALKAGVPPRTLRPWLYTIAHNECISLLRARPSAEPLADVPDPAIERLEDRVELREQLRQLRRDLLSLPAAQREALVLRELSGLSHREIGEVMGETPAVVKQYIYEARQTLLEFGAGRDLACGEVRRRLVDADGRVMRARRMTSHLRACEGCRAFVADEEHRRRGLLILFPPLPAAAAAHILSGVVPGGGASGGSWWSNGSSSGQGTGLAVGGLALGAVAASVAVALAVAGGSGSAPPPTNATSPAASASASAPAGAGGSGSPSGARVDDVRRGGEHRPAPGGGRRGRARGVRRRRDGSRRGRWVRGPADLGRRPSAPGVGAPPRPRRRLARRWRGLGRGRARLRRIAGRARAPGRLGRRPARHRPDAGDQGPTVAAATTTPSGGGGAAEEDGGGGSTPAGATTTPTTTDTTPTGTTPADTTTAPPAGTTTAGETPAQTTDTTRTDPSTGPVGGGNTPPDGGGGTVTKPVDQPPPTITDQPPATTVDPTTGQAIDRATTIEVATAARAAAAVLGP